MSNDSQKPSTSWRIEIDADRCQGHNRCFSLAPQLFDVDEFGQGFVRPEAMGLDELRERAELATANCPEFAIRFIDTPSA